MKKIFFLLLLVSTAFIGLKAQDGNRSTGLGFNMTLPVPALSLKVGITPQLQVQALAAPVAVLTEGNAIYGYGAPYYGGRVSWRFVKPRKFCDPMLFPYVYGGAGVMLGERTDVANNNAIVANNKLGWAIGVGLEAFPRWLDNLGAHVELGFGANSFDAASTAAQPEAFTMLQIGFGLHYYFF